MCILCHENEHIVIEKLESDQMNSSGPKPYSQ